MKWIAAFTVGLLLAVASAQAGMIEDFAKKIASLYGSHEEAPYEVTREAPGYQERTYSPKKWACTRRESPNSDVMESMFWRLYKYFSGLNEEGTFIYMTVPVTTEYRVLDTTMNQYTMCFYLDEKHQSSPPTPQDSEVFVENRGELVILTRTVGGYFETQEHWLEEAGKLAAVITSNGEKVSLAHQYWAGYDAPLKFWNRRNEVWFLKRY
ncbi:heme-binding protein 2-like [Macrobrachium rosenbergii]|uniref:heme-binding protein 2-like n=1 Tax=Macrobrachium rosenbergii TaxID=79674 RepID=UPI0034D577B5